MYKLWKQNLFHTNYEIIFIRVIQGGRSVFAEVIRVSTPNNFYACQLSLAASFALCHGIRLRRVTAGQLPVVSIWIYEHIKYDFETSIVVLIYMHYLQVCLKSLQRGKSQGKSGVGRLIMKCVSDWNRNKF